MDCKDYQPGPVMGKERAVCRFYNKSNNGSCNRQDLFMCVLYLAQKLGGKIVRVEERKDENN